MADPVHYTNTKPSLTLTPEGGGTAVELNAHANGIDAVPEQAENDYETYTGSFTAYGAERWTITVNGLQSFGADGLWSKLRPLVGTSVTFQLIPYADDAVSEDNPAMTGTARLRAFAFVTGSKGDPSEVEVVLKVQGTPAFATAPVAPFAGLTVGAGDDQADTDPEAA